VIAGAQLRPQRHVADKDIERQITIVAIIGVEVPALLRAVQQVAHRIQIDHHFARVPGQAARPHPQETLLDLVRIVRQPMTARLLVVGQLQSVERGRGGQRHAAMLRQKTILPERIAFVAGGGQQRVQAETVVIVEVFITQRQPIEPLGQQLLERVIDKTLIAGIDKASRQRAGQTQAVINLAQEQDAAVAGERAAGKIGHDLTRTQVLKEHGLVTTVCPRSSGRLCFHLAE